MNNLKKNWHDLFPDPSNKGKIISIDKRIEIYNIAHDDEPITKEILFEAIKAPYYTILDNADIVEIKKPSIKNRGIDVRTGREVNMIKSGIIDPVLVTKSALKNAVSVVTTIVSADCVISNKRLA